jgi:hypothetical protein
MEFMERKKTRRKLWTLGEAEALFLIYRALCEVIGNPSSD